MAELQIKGFLETSFIDWDGKIVSVVYVPLCNFHCPFCHNSGLVKDPQIYETIAAEKIEKYLLEHKDFIDGVCITGGEPCLHEGSGLFEFMRKIKDLGFQIKLDTNGTMPEVLGKAIAEKLIDFIAMDIKGPLDGRYDKLSGVKTDIGKIKESIRIIKEGNVPYEFRMTVIPTLLGKKEIEAAAKYLAGAKLFILQQFDPKNTWDEALRTVKPYSKEELYGMAEAARAFIKDVRVRGV